MMDQTARRICCFTLLVVGLALAGCGSKPTPEGDAKPDFTGRWRHVVTDGVVWRLELSKDSQFTREFANAQVPGENHTIKGTWSMVESDPKDSKGAETRQLSTVRFEYWAPKDTPLPVGASVLDYRGGPSVKKKPEPEEVHVRETYQTKITKEGEKKSLTLVNFETLSDAVPGSQGQNEKLPISRQVPQRFEQEQ